MLAVGIAENSVFQDRTFRVATFNTLGSQGLRFVSMAGDVIFALDHPTGTGTIGKSRRLSSRPDRSRELTINSHFTLVPTNGYSSHLYLWYCYRAGFPRRNTSLLMSTLDRPISNCTCQSISLFEDLLSHLRRLPNSAV